MNVVIYPRSTEMSDGATIVHMHTREYDPGLIPLFLNQRNPAPAQQQLSDGYMQAARCDYRPFEGFTLMDDNTLVYQADQPEEERDPPYEPRATIHMPLTQEFVVMYDYSWVAVIQKDRSFVVARMD